MASLAPRISHVSFSRALIYEARFPVSSSSVSQRHFLLSLIMFLVYRVSPNCNAITWRLLDRFTGLSS